MSDTVLDDRTATISPCGTYRYDLTRRWADGPIALWIMLNPSTADAIEDDPTIRRCISFSKREGCGKLVVVNLYAFRSTDPKALLAATDAVGPQNHDTIRYWMSLPQTSAVVAAWGAWPTTQRHAPARPAVEQFARQYEQSLRCLGTTKAGAPRHPLYVKGDQPLLPLKASA